MSAAINIEGNKVTRKATKTVVRDLCQLMREGAEAGVSGKTLQYAMEVYGDFLRNTATRPISISNCDFGMGEKSD